MKKNLQNTAVTFAITLILMTFALLPKSWADGMQASIKVQGDTLNFEVSGQKNWDYDVKRVQEGSQVKVQLQVKGLDEASTKNLKSIENPFVKSIKVLPKAIDGFTVVEFLLSDDTIDAFDYLTDQPSKLVVDFYRNEDRVPKKKIVAAAVKPVKKDIKSAQATVNPKLSASRKPADVDHLQIQDENGVLTFVDQEVDLKAGLFDGGDEKFRRFKIKEIEIQQNAIIKGLANYYLKFPMLNHDFLFWTAIKSNPPDYSIHGGNSDENKQARLLKVLFDNKRHLVLKKTTDWFEKKFPHSDYLESAYYMNGDSMLELWKKTGESKYFDDANLFYSKAVQKFPHSKLNERTSLFIGLLNIDKKDYLTAIRKLNAHVENPEYKGKPSQEYAKIGLAYSILQTNKLDDAITVLEDVENNSKNELTQAEASYRKGDFYFHDEKYDKAIEAYDKAFKKFNKYTQLFPNAHFNKMEALFRAKKPELSHAEALDFVQRYPAHDYAPYALTRVGELLEILGAEQSKSVGAFLETHFRYGDNPKTVISRLHLLSTRMKVMKEQEVKETIAKMNELAEKNDLNDIQQFKTTMIADGYSRRKEFSKAIDILTQFYQKEPNKPDSYQVTLRIVRNINDQIKNYSASDDFKNVLKTYKKYSDTWLRTQPRIDTNFYVGRAYQSAGSYSTALKKYDKVTKQISLLKDDSFSKAIKANQDLPTSDTLSLLQAQCLYEENKLQEAYEKMQKIEKPEQLSPQDQISRVHYAALMYEKKGELNAAVRYLSELTKVWHDKAELLAPSIIHLADLEVKRKQPLPAIDHLSQLIENKISDKYKLVAYKKLVNIAVAEKNNDLAVKTITNLLASYEATEALSSERFKLGEIYFSRGEIKKAEDVWAELKGSDSTFWSQLAQNKLRDASWSEENSKYLKRIPAMSRDQSREDSK